jgi:DNA-binding beta-propeller fold protein YncE
MTRKALVGGPIIVPLLMALAGMWPRSLASVQARTPSLPVFDVDYRFPTMPEKMMLGGVSGVAADSHGNVWVFHRPHTLEEENALLNGYTPGPPVLCFDEKGNYVRGWGGPISTDEYEWPNRGGLFSAYAPCQSCTSERRRNGDGRAGSGEHGIFVDYKDNVWLTSNGAGDGQILKFTKEGKFLLQIGHGVRSAAAAPRAAGTLGSNDPENVDMATALVVYQKTKEVLVTDGYGHRRVVVFDADTGKYKRHWGAYGNKPDDNASRERSLSGPGSPQFNIVHGITISDDGVVYVADRGNNRVQSFTIDGKFLKEGYIRRETQGSGSAFGVALSHDQQQKFLYVADGSNDRIAVLDRNTLEVIGQIGRPGRKSGEFFHIHSLATDPHGNIITGESQGYRVQRFLYKGISGGATQ